MTNIDTDFDSWFDIVAFEVFDKTGYSFNDRDSVREDYDEGNDAYDVADEIIDEYQD